MTSTALERSPQLRAINPRRDLDQVADLVELCFAEWMDDEGRIYIRQMRRAARDARMLRPQGMRVEGFVWEEEGRIIGNVTLIPFARPDRLLYLIANVAVHPDHRRLGIARQLTHAGMVYARERRAQACWLQVREDNPGAIKLYRLLGFVDRALRSTWQRDRAPARSPNPSPVEVTYRRAGDWPKQSAWLKAIYPADVRWNLHFDPDKLRPTFWDAMFGWLGSPGAQHWEARLHGRPAGFATWMPTRALVDQIWLAPDPEVEEPALEALLAAAARHLGAQRPLAVNYPSGRAGQAFTRTGFTLRHTLLWMEAPFRKNQS